MKDLKDLTWSDIKSDLISSQEFKTKIKEKPEKWKNYQNYDPKKKTIKKIKNFLEKKNQKLKIIAIGAEWCGDCAIQLPRMVKISEEFDRNFLEFYILYGIRVNAFHKEGESKWHKQKSPPEATDPKFDLHAIPTIYIFDKEGNYLNRIIEKPTNKETLEKELLYLLSELQTP
jgi:thiol-disulfide isomerase/thioredoxin